MPREPNKYFPPAAALLLGASAWGLFWYPYRLLEAAGIGGILATLLTYAVALAIAAIAFPSAYKQWSRSPWALAVVALAAGCANLFYVLGMLAGEVMRVLLLFYLAPLWTVPLAALVLGERPSAIGYLIIALAFAGAVVMLWQPAGGAPWLQTGAEWYGLGSGFAFSLANVVTRRLDHVGVPAKSLALFAGVIGVCLVGLVFAGSTRQLNALHAGLSHWPLLIGVGVCLFAMSLMLQYGLTHMSANRAIVIMLFELVVAAVSAYWLAGEAMGAREWIGGLMIVGASLFSGKITAPPKTERHERNA
jgi:drug/metabolite transporter (DMT)-like permease